MNIPLRSLLAVVSAAVFCCSICAPQASAQAASDAAKPILETATHIEDNFIALAKAIPADKYDFAPGKEIFKSGSAADFATVRTIAQQLTHVAAMPYRMLAPFGVKPDREVDVKSFDSMTAKDEIVKALQASFDYQNKVIAGMTPDNAFTLQGPRKSSMLAMLVMMFNDYGDHYGQLVEYGRMNGIVPPATQRQSEMHHETAPKM